MIQDEWATLSKIRAIDHDQSDFLMSEGTSVWILITWRSWENQIDKSFMKCMNTSITWRVQDLKKLKTINRLHCEIFVVNEPHTVRNLRKRFFVTSSIHFSLFWYPRAWDWYGSERNRRWTGHNTRWRMKSLKIFKVSPSSKSVYR